MQRGGTLYMTLGRHAGRHGRIPNPPSNPPSDPHRVDLHALPTEVHLQPLERGEAVQVGAYGHGVLRQAGRAGRQEAGRPGRQAAASALQQPWTDLSRCLLSLPTVAFCKQPELAGSLYSHGAKAGRPALMGQHRLGTTAPPEVRLAHLPVGVCLHHLIHVLLVHLAAVVAAAQV